MKSIKELHIQLTHIVYDFSNEKNKAEEVNKLKAEIETSCYGNLSTGILIGVLLSIAMRLILAI